MGLEGVGLLMEVEDRFGVTISDEEAGAIGTVGDLLTLVQGRVEKRDIAGCLSLPWFLRLRAAVRETVADPSFRIRPSEIIDKRLLRSERKYLWRQLSRLMGKPARELRRPDVLCWSLVLTLVAVFASMIWLPTQRVANALGHFHFPLAIAVTLIATWLLLRITEPFAASTPAGYRTFGDITKRLVGREAARVGFPADRTDILLEELTEIIVHHLGVDSDEVTTEARFVEDLICD